MSPEVLARKLAKLREYLADLRPFAGSPLMEGEREHYVVERLLQLIVEVGTDLLAHELAAKNVVPTSYRDTVRKSVEAGFIDQELGDRLERASGLRNILVHLYEEVDLEILAESVRPTLEDYGELLIIFQRRLEEMGE